MLIPNTPGALAAATGTAFATGVRDVPGEATDAVRAMATRARARARRPGVKTSLRPAISIFLNSLLCIMDPIAFL